MDYTENRYYQAALMIVFLIGLALIGYIAATTSPTNQLADQQAKETQAYYDGVQDACTYLTKDPTRCVLFTQKVYSRDGHKVENLPSKMFPWKDQQLVPLGNEPLQQKAPVAPPQSEGEL